MRQRHITLIALFISALSSLVTASGQAPKYSPGGTFGKNQFVSVWYSQALTDLNEPSLLPLIEKRNSEAYRFLWLRSFHQPVAIRIIVNPDGTGMIFTRVAKGRSPQPTMAIREDALPLTSDQLRPFTTEIARDHFFALPTSGPQGGCDGAEWIVEAVAGGKYHIVSRWSPTSGPAYVLGTLALKLANVDVPPHEFY